MTEVKANYPRWAIALAVKRGWRSADAHRLALNVGAFDHIAATHPYNYLTEDEVERAEREAMGLR